MAKTKRNMSPQARKAASERAKKMDKQNKKRAAAQLKEAKKNWNKIAKDWLKKSGRKTKTVKGKRLNVYFQFLGDIKKQGASHALAMMLWKKHSPGTEYEAKTKDTKKGKGKGKGKKASANTGGSLARKRHSTRIVGKRMSNGKMAYYKVVKGKMTRISKDAAIKMRKKSKR